MKKLALTLTFAVVFCFVATSPLYAQECLSKELARDYMPNAYKAVSKPFWQITQDGTNISVQWIDAPNPRFALYDPGTPGDTSDDIVLDKETGLVWARQANLLGGATDWHNAVYQCLKSELGNRRGWRLGTIEEMLTLIDPSQSTSPALPAGHPFVNLLEYSYYWSSTTNHSDSDYAVALRFSDGQIFSGVIGTNKQDPALVWPVRGGNGYATGYW